jgi:predicted nucleic acid-binding protein
VRFVDTNVLLYAVSTAADERRKSAVALALVDENDLALSVQVLQEFYVQSTRAEKSERISHEQAARLIESWLRFPVKEIDVPLMQAAMQTAKRFRISYWDAAIIEAARALECETLLSEDLSHGQDYDGVRVVDPFRKRS